MSAANHGRSPDGMLNASRPDMTNARHGDDVFEHVLDDAPRSRHEVFR
jgi:hypothetical protein